MQALLLLTLVFAVLVAIFAIQNAHLVTIYFLKWQFDASLGLIILFSLLIGAVLLGVFDLINQAKIKWKKPWWSREKKEVPEAETSVGGISEAGTEPEKSAKLGGEHDNPQKLEDY
ncbi:MAG: LapA family protein [Firmicutes bacterium]|nr:LapA family protein [Bacillota bacterium]